MARPESTVELRARRRLLPKHRGQVDAAGGDSFQGPTGASSSVPPTAVTIDRSPKIAPLGPESSIRGKLDEVDVDITYIPTAQGWVYLAVVLDLCSRKVIGWATADHLRTELPSEALEMALTHRRPQGELLHHSDRGVQYASDSWSRLGC